MATKNTILGTVPKSRGRYTEGDTTTKWYYDNILEYKGSSFRCISNASTGITGAPATYNSSTHTLVPNTGWEFFVDTTGALDVEDRLFEQEERLSELELNTDTKLTEFSKNTNIINVNQANNVPKTAYESAVVARDAVPADSRKYGVLISYLLSDGWHLEQYKGNAINPWLTGDQYWIPYEWHPELVIYNVNMGNSQTRYTLADAIALVPLQYRGIARAITYLDIDGNCVFALFNDISYISNWTNPNNWTIYDKNVFKSVITGNVGISSKGVLSIQGTSSRQFIVGDGSNIGIIVNSNEFYINIKSIDSFGYWRIYLFYADGTNAFSGVTNGLNTFEKEVVGFSIALNSNTNLCTLDYEVYTGVRCEIEKNRQRIAVLENKTYTAEDFGAISKSQGQSNAGKTLVVGPDGNVSLGLVTPVGVLIGYAKTENSADIFLKSDIVSEVSVGEGWSGDLVNGYTHSSGTDALVLGHTDNGKKYLVTLEYSDVLETSVEVKIGNSYPVDPYNGTSKSLIGFVSDGGDLQIIPNTNYKGTIKAKLQEITTDDESVESVKLNVNNFDAGLMISSISGFWNVAIGSDSDTMGNIVNATRCIGIGVNALRNLISGSRNIGIGTFALAQLLFGKGNIGIGADTYYRRNGGDDNIAIGRASMGGSTESVNNNVCVGVSAGEKATGDDNVCIGPIAGYIASGGCVFIGKNAGYSHNGLNNTFIGRNAGYSGKVKSGDWNTCIGPSTDCLDGVSKSTAIGFQAFATKSSQTVIGSEDTQEFKVFGDVVVHGTDGVDRRIVFNSDHSVTWE